MSLEVDLVPTPSQTVGPYFHLGLTATRSIACLAPKNVRGERIWVNCCVLDGDGVPVDDAMIEIWQADGEGNYYRRKDPSAQAKDSEFRGFGRMETAADGTCRFETIKPGRVRGLANRWQAPHLNLSVFARGLLQRLPTRIYFAGDSANQEDPILELVPERRRGTLMARPDPAHPASWSFAIYLCGERETVFFDV